MEHIIDEDEGMNKIDTGAEEEKVLEFNRANTNIIFFLSFLVSLILTIL